MEKNKKIILLILLFLISSLSILAFYFINKNNKKDSIKNMENTEVTKLPKSQLALKIDSYIKIENNQGVANIYNKPENVYDIIVKIYLEDSNELIYETPLLSPGQYIETITLDKNLDVGNYSAIAYFNAYDNGKYVGKSGATLKIIVGG